MLCGGGDESRSRNLADTEDDVNLKVMKGNSTSGGEDIVPLVLGRGVLCRF